MPNTLAHLGIQGVVTRSIIRKADIKWIFLGAVLPDIPWIARRIVIAVLPGIDPVAVRIYAIAQSSLFSCLILAVAFSLFSQIPRRVFAILSLNALLHLLVDASEAKWGNGVHLLAPYSWDTFNLGLFWPESTAVFLLSLVGMIFVVYIWLKGSWGVSMGLRFPTSRKGLAITILIVFYLVLPALVMTDIKTANAHSIARINDPCKSCQVAFDRAKYYAGDRHRLKTWAKEYSLQEKYLNHSAIVSIKGSFVDETTIQINSIHEHKGINRDLLSYIGLLLILAVWANDFIAIKLKSGKKYFNRA